MNYDSDCTCTSIFTCSHVHSSEVQYNTHTNTVLLTAAPVRLTRLPKHFTGSKIESYSSSSITY